MLLKYFREQLEDALAICKSENDVLQKQLAQSGCTDEHSDEPSQEAAKPSLHNAASRKRETDSIFDIDEASPKKMKRVPEKFKLSFALNDKDDSDIVLVSVYYFFRKL